MKLALAMIVKGSDEEAKVLRRCLKSVSPYVDGIFITITQPNDAVEKVANQFKATISHFEWCNDFSQARNFNFSQVPKEFSHILWLDADDVLAGAEKLKDVIEQNPGADAFVFNYIYDFDENDLPTVVHMKTQVVKNDGCVKWAGKLHEDFASTRSLESYLVKDIQRIHRTDEKRVETAKYRNEEISREGVINNPDDPREYWNLGNSLFGVGRYEEAKETFEHFLKTSESDDEKYIAHLRLLDLCQTLGNSKLAIDHGQRAIGLKPTYPDAYFSLGRVNLQSGNLDKAEEYFLIGLVQPKPYHQIIVYNPRDYDYNPMMLLSQIYILKGLPHYALTLQEACLKIMPENKKLKEQVELVRKEKDKIEVALKAVEKIQDIKDDAEFLKAIEALPVEIQSAPVVCYLRNKRITKKESSGKDMVIYCGMTEHEWNPELFKTKGFGGSEEAVIHLSSQFKQLGWNVTVYANCGHKALVCDGVTWKPFWSWNYRDKQDVTIIWRHPKPLDFDINSDKIFIDLHDVVPPGEFNEKRLARIDKIFVKSNFHRSLFPNIPNEKFAVVPNGADLTPFKVKVTKDPLLLINTSSPDRSLDVLPELFMRVKEKVPEAKCKWAYGWDIFDDFYGGDEEKQTWKKGVIEKMKEAGIEVVGRLPQHEVAKLYLEGNILAYPTEFAEIDCISVRKAQAGGCFPITTDFSATRETNVHGTKVISFKNNDTWTKPGKWTFGIEDEKTKEDWVDAVVKQLQKPVGDRSEMQEWATDFTWDKIAQQWNEQITLSQN